MNKNISKLAILSSCLALSACFSVGPDYAERDMSENFADEFVPSEDLSKSEEIDATFDSSEIKTWWEIFNDPVLTSLIERAFKTNYDLQIARANVSAARASLGMAASGLLPNMDVDGSLKESGTGRTATTLGYGAGIGANWEIDIFGGTRRTIESSAYDLKSKIFDAYAVKLEVASEVARAYFTYRGNCELYAITLENIKIQQSAYDITNELVKHSFGSEIDHVRAKAQLQTTTSELPSIRQRIESSRRALELLLGVKMDSLKDELKEPKKLPAVEKIVPSEVPASLIKRRPDLISSIMKIQSANARIGQAYAEYLPKFYVSGNISYSAPTSANMFQNQYGSWSVGPTVSWNLFNGGKTYYNVRYQKALTEIAGLSFEKAALTAITEVQDNIELCAKSKKTIELLNIAAESDLEAYKLSKELYETGSIKFIDLLETQRTLLNVQQTLVSLRLGMLEEAIALYKSLGGGWDVKNLNKAIPLLYEFEKGHLKTKAEKKE